MGGVLCCFVPVCHCRRLVCAVLRDTVGFSINYRRKTKLKLKLLKYGFTVETQQRALDSTSALVRWSCVRVCEISRRSIAVGVAPAPHSPLNQIVAVHKNLSQLFKVSN